MNTYNEEINVLTSNTDSIVFINFTRDETHTSLLNDWKRTVRSLECKILFSAENNFKTPSSLVNQGEIT